MTRCSDVEIGIFITQNPIRNGINWYAYCNGNPINYVDPDGKKITVSGDETYIYEEISAGLGFFRKFSTVP